mmetsp:Transcript_122526/g.357788  ORF Transcript_122526/g.357788 Transcript_122526/m.357788 type:complete len:207 (-) Transcript_122526:154-774(-)
MCVRPILITSPNSATFLSNSPNSVFRAGRSCSRSASTMAMCMAALNASLVLWPRFTWSFGWTTFCPPAPFRPSSFARMRLATLARTSFTFMLVCVPLPVWKTTRGNCVSSRSSLDRTSCAARAIADEISGPSARALASAADCFSSSSALIMRFGMRSSLILKFCSERCVCAAHRACSGTRTVPWVSCSTRIPSGTSVSLVARTVKM